MPWRTSPEWSPRPHRGEHGFKSHPGYCDQRVGWAPASPSGCNPPANTVQVQLLPDTLTGLVDQLAEQDSLKVEVQGSTPCGATALILGVSSNGKDSRILRAQLAPRSAENGQVVECRHAVLRRPCPPWREGSSPSLVTE